jgi:lysyl-tRNA synthetase class 2
MPSTVIRRFHYSPDQRLLCVEFTTGKYYQYSDVEPEAVERLRGAFSKGRHFNAHIRDRYACCQVSRCEPPSAIPQAEPE